MRTNFLYSLALACMLIVIPGCSDDDNGNGTPNIPDVGDVTENGNGPSTEDQSILPTSAEFLGDSIQRMLRYSLQTTPVNMVRASTTQNGHIALMGGYKDEAAVYIYAKADDDKSLSKEDVDNILNKYYIVKSDISGGTIDASVVEKTDISHDADYRKLRVSMKIFTPRSVSSQLSLENGGIFASSVTGPQHKAMATNGSIKYIDSNGKTIDATSTNGYIAFINTTASETLNARLQKGSIQIAVPTTTKAHLNLSSNTNVTATGLNTTNFSGTNTRNLVQGDLNGGGASINAVNSLGSVLFKWYYPN